jgi:hypothetical protein
LGICSKLERSMGATATEMCRDLHRVLDELLDVDPHGLDAAELHAVVVETHRVAARLAAARARHTAEWDTRGVWGSNGTRTAALRLGNECRLSPESAAVEMRRARKLREMPHTFDALARGEISVDHVDLLGRANYGPRAGFFPESEKLLVDSCASMRYRHAERVVAYWRQHADAEGADTEAEALVEHRNLSAARTFDGSVYLRGLLDPLGGTVVLDELTRLERQLYEAEKASGEITRNPAQRRADALVEMATRSASTPPGARRPRPLYTILVGFETFAGRICQLDDETVVAPGQLVGGLSEADIERVVFDPAGRIIDVSNRRRFTGALRRSIQVRDRHCQHPSGCDEPSSACDVDHIIPHSQRGDTSYDNGRLACPTHNRHPDKRDPPKTNRKAATPPQPPGEPTQRARPPNEP